MNTRKALLTVAIAGVLSTTSLISTTSAYASDATTEATQNTATTTIADSSDTTGTASETPMLKTQENTLDALQSIQAARIALFNGSPEEALKLTDKAQTDLQTAQQFVDDYALSANSPDSKDARYIPFETSMSLSEDFVPDEAGNVALAEASDQFSSGKESDAIQTLKLANIDVSVSAAMLPPASSLEHVGDALEKMNEEKYYEANLALKAVEDSVLVQQYDLFALPVQGSPS